MSALVRTASVYSNNSQVLNTMSNGHGIDHGSLVTARNIPNTASPLQIFVRAKKKINDVFADIENYTEESLRFLEALPEDEDIVSKDSVHGIKGYSGKVHAIRDVLSRDHMKCVFFGRTSNGKSSVINAMLREKILPSGIGHTTNCFLQVEGSENGESYLITEDSNEKQNVKSVAQLAHALCTEKIGDSALMRVVWPKDKCPLLRDDVVFVDSPGIDVSPNLDEWIDKHCLDADVFVLVANAESTLMLTEKNFFHKVSSRLSKPNIFILNNRWDASANEPEYLDEVRKQHLQRSVDFLVNELRVISSEQEAKNRVFFVSAKEVLQARVNEQKGLSLNTGISTPNFTERLFEFQDFEKRFEECISRSAVRTKFDQHTTRGKSIVSDVRSVMEKVHESAIARCEQKSRERVHLAESIEETERQMLLITKEAKHRICNMVEEVEMKVSKAISEEIRRLSILVEEFNEPFDSNPLVLNEFKKKLHRHVDYGLVTNLRSRLTSAVAMNMEAAKKEMATRVINILPETKRDTVQLPVDTRPFEVQYPFRCDNLCADFREDIEFKFSFGVLTVVNRLVGGKNGILRRLIRNRNEEVPRPLALTPETPVIETASLLASEDWSVVSKFAMATVSSQGAMGGLLIGGFELSSTFARLGCFVDNASVDMQNQLEEVERSIQLYDAVGTEAKKLRNKANYIINELDLFEEAFLKST